MAVSRAYIVPWGFEDDAGLPRAPFIDDPHLYPPSPRRDTYGSMASAAIGNPRPAHAAAFFDRTDHTSPGRRPRSIQGNVTFPASHEEFRSSKFGTRRYVNAAAAPLLPKFKN